MTTDCRRGLRATLRDLYERHRRTFWTLHSLWALATGALVVVLAHESYGYAAWVLAFLALTWLSTLFFSRAAKQTEHGRRPLRHEFVSYLTRVMYQETLFFLLPFYTYSTTLRSANVAFLVLLLLLAVLACLDLVFDDLLCNHRWFGLFFFAVVSFAALNFLLPLVFGLPLELATALAAVLGLLAAIPMVDVPAGRPRWRWVASLILPALLGAGLLVSLRPLVPPVPLQLEELAFAHDVRRDTLEPMTPLGRRADLAAASDRLAVVATIFAPRRVSVRAWLQWQLDGETLKESRDLEISAHPAGFKVWDGYSPTAGPLTAGAYTVSLRTTGGQLIGRARLQLID